ncbi:hypothetical protein ADN00_07875 [Ornatilinea apprima]|uniref:Uncharacterized protein n=1 Tax=Ornatilinea apprima TaxID=1134406 RepID=A0A0P6X7X0_9CHLR|nr:hypothetical protein [Ornatilinea apprima]KPL78085.1 hypothetical protein ADN00_07875 [Ornatilinea apprima]
MFQVSKLKTFGRVALLVLLLATTMGPWFADSHPATEESCSRPLVWLGDGYCACLIPLKDYVEGALGHDVMWLLCLPPALPVLSTLLLLLFGERQWLWICHLSAWGIAGIYAFLWFGGAWYAHRGVLILWGAGLGGVVAVALLIGEMLIARLQFSMNHREELS